MWKLLGFDDMYYRGRAIADRHLVHTVAPLSQKVIDLPLNQKHYNKIYNTSLVTSLVPIYYFNIRFHKGALVGGVPREDGGCRRRGGVSIQRAMICSGLCKILFWPL